LEKIILVIIVKAKNFQNNFLFIFLFLLKEVWQEKKEIEEEFA